MNPCAKFGSDRSSRLADYKEHTGTQTNRQLNRQTDIRIRLNNVSIPGPLYAYCASQSTYCLVLKNYTLCPKKVVHQTHGDTLKAWSCARKFRGAIGTDALLTLYVSASLDWQEAQCSRHVRPSVRPSVRSFFRPLSNL